MHRSPMAYIDGLISRKMIEIQRYMRSQHYLFDSRNVKISNPGEELYDCALLLFSSQNRDRQVGYPSYIMFTLTKHTQFRVFIFLRLVLVKLGLLQLWRDMHHWPVLFRHIMMRHCILLRHGMFERSLLVILLPCPFIRL